jgi:hypothetical protein
MRERWGITAVTLDRIEGVGTFSQFAPVIARLSPGPPAAAAEIWRTLRLPYLGPAPQPGSGSRWIEGEGHSG